MKLTPLQRRAERRARNHSDLDMNLVSLIDIFTILIFFLMSGASGVELLSSPKEVRLPKSMAEKAPKETIVVAVSGRDILVDGRRVASVSDVMGAGGDLIEPLRSELELLASRPALREENQGKNKAVTIMGDKDIPYQLLRKVMFTAARANFTDVSFAVNRKVVS
jgi:biopolymer transport protein TolR